MSRHSIYLPDSDDKFLEEEKMIFGSISKVIHVSLNLLREEKMKEYYLQKSESYPELRKAQEKVIRRQEKEEKL
jgi:Arc/MetJ-type ribon-helix-helix transcriptional regulator